MEKEIRRNEDGTVDEVVGEGHYHLEQMNDNEWCLIVDKTILYLTSSKKIELVEAE